jgi:zinc protease
MTAAMLNEATTESSNEELSNRLQKLGSNINIYATKQFTTISIKSISENLDETLAIAAERLFKPAFSESDFSRVKDQTIEGIKQSKKQARVTANNVLNHLMYGKENSFAYPAQGTIESVQNILLDDVKDFYASQYSPKISNVVAVSDLSKKELSNKLGVFAKWQGPVVTPVDLKPFPEFDKTRIYLVDKPGAAQSEIRVAKRALPYDATGEYHTAGLMNYALGGAFNSRININLREDKGYTYGARATFRGDEDNGLYVASAGVRSDATDKSLLEFIKEISSYYSGGISDEELAFTKSSIGQRDARSYETPSQKLGFLSRIQTYGLSDDFVEVQKSILSKLSKTEANALAKQYLDINSMTIVIVGDKATILDGLKTFGYEIIELDADANSI